MNPLHSKWFSLLVIIFVGCLVFLLLGLSARRAEFEQAAKDAQNKVQTAERDKAHIEKFLAYFKSPQFLEKQAKMKLNYKSPDEKVAFIFRDPNPKIESNSQDWLNHEPNYKKWWYYILGY